MGPHFCDVLIFDLLVLLLMYSFLIQSLYLCMLHGLVLSVPPSPLCEDSTIT